MKKPMAVLLVCGVPLLLITAASAQVPIPDHCAQAVSLSDGSPVIIDTSAATSGTDPVDSAVLADYIAPAVTLVSVVPSQ